MARLRRGGPEDGAACAALFHAAVLRGAARDYPSPARQAWAARNAAPEIWAARLARGETWIAEIGGQPSGFVLRRGALLDLLFVAPEFYGQGIASALAARSVLGARRAGVRHYQCYASHSLAAVLVRQGWRARRRNRLWLGGVRIENHLVVRPLARPLGPEKRGPNKREPKKRARDAQRARR